VKGLTGIALGILLGILSLPTTTMASEPGEVASGASTLRSVEDGERDCADLGDSDFEAVGEYAMESMLGSQRAHEGMDRMIASMMGAGGLGQMHRYMGQSFTRCGGGDVSGGLGGMMGMMGGGYSDGSGAFGPGMMGNLAAANDGGNNDNWDGAAALMLVMMIVLVAGLIVWSMTSRRRRPGSGAEARSILDRRLASGEIDRDEFESRRSALGGS